MHAAVKEVKEFSAARKESLRPVRPGQRQASAMGKVIPFPLNKVNPAKPAKMPGLKDDYRGFAQEAITVAVKPTLENGAFTSSARPFVGRRKQTDKKMQPAWTTRPEWTTRPNPVLDREEAIDSAFSFLFTKAEPAVENSATRTASGVRSRKRPEQKNTLPLVTRQHKAVKPDYRGSFKVNSATISQLDSGFQLDSGSQLETGSQLDSGSQLETGSQLDSGQNKNGQEQLGANKKEANWKNLLLGCLTALVLFGIGGFLGGNLGNSEADILPSSSETVQQVEVAQAGMAIW